MQLQNVERPFPDGNTQLESILLQHICQKNYSPHAVVVPAESVSAKEYLQKLKYVTTVACMCRNYHSPCECKACPCKSEGSQVLGDTRCGCGTMVFSAYKDTNTFVRYFMSWDYVMRNLTSIGRRLVRTAISKYPGRLMRVPPTYFSSFLERNTIANLRFSGIAGYYEGQLKSNESVVIPLGVAEIDALRCPGDKKLPNSVRENLRTNTEGGNSDWVKIPSGSKRKRDGGAYMFFNPIELVPYTQPEGSMTCVAHSAASLMAVLATSDTDRWKALEYGARFMILQATDHEGDYPEDRHWRILIQQVLKDYGGQVVTVTGSFDCTLELALKNPSAANLVLLKSRNAYPHVVGIIGQKLYDPSEHVVLEHNRHNLDLICGGKGQYLGIVWADQFRRRSVPNERYQRELCLLVPSISNNYYLSPPASVLEAAMMASASAAHEFGMHNIAKGMATRARKRTSNSNRQLASAELCHIIKESFDALLADTRSVRFEVCLIRSPAMECLQRAAFGIAKLKHKSRNIIVSFCGQTLFVPWFPNALRLTTDNLAWLAETNNPAIEWTYLVAEAGFIFT